MNVKSFIDTLPLGKQIPQIAGKNSLFHFDFGTEGKYSVKISDGVMSLEEGHVGAATCTVSTSPENFSKLLKGELNPMMAVMTGKLKISNPTEVMQYAKVFGLG